MVADAMTSAMHKSFSNWAMTTRHQNFSLGIFLSAQPLLEFPNATGYIAIPENNSQYKILKIFFFLSVVLFMQDSIYTKISIGLTRPA